MMMCDMNTVDRMDSRAARSCAQPSFACGESVLIMGANLLASIFSFFTVRIICAVLNRNGELYASA